jgi:tetratricopeptide (TPR) repeat protein
MALVTPFALFLLAFFFYLRTHCASFNINDSGETILVCYRMTVGHSPGYPLHTLWGRVNCLLEFGQPMLRVTMASMIMGSLSVVLVYLILRHLFSSLSSTQGVLRREGAGIGLPAWTWEACALFGALVFGFSYQHWFQAGGCKGGIYTLNTFLSLAMIYLLFLMRERGWMVKSLPLMGYLYGLGLAHHWPNQIVLTPVYAFLFMAGQSRVPPGEYFASLLKPFTFYENSRKVLSAFGMANLVRSVTFGFIGVSVYSFLTLRAHLKPLVNWWDPDNYIRLWETATRKGYAGIGDKRSAATLLRNWKRFLLQFYNQYGDVFTWVVLLLAVWGLWWLLKRHWTSAAGFFGMGFCLFVSVMIFNNPAEGYQWTLDNFFTPIFLSMAMLAAAGLFGLVELLLKRMPTPGRILWIVPVLVLLASLLPMRLNWQRTNQERYVSAYDYGVNMLRTVDRNAVIVCNGDIDILPLWYMQYVLGMRPETACFTMQLIPYPWYLFPLMKQYPYLAVPVGRDVRPETVVQDMINYRGKERSFYFTNIFTAPWMRERNPSIPEGFLWRIFNTKDMNFAFTAEHANRLWSGYRLRSLDAPQRGYWDEYTDVMKDSYGIGHDFAGYFASVNASVGEEFALWSFHRALKYRQPQTSARIYFMLGEVYMKLTRGPDAVEMFRKVLEIEPRNAQAFSKLGRAYFHMGDLENSEMAFRTALALTPQQPDPDAVEGVSVVQAVREGRIQLNPAAPKR